MNDEEKNILESKFKSSELFSKSQFIRTMILESVAVRFDSEIMRSIVRNISSIAANINQVAVRVNSTGSIHANKKELLYQMIQQLYF